MTSVYNSLVFMCGLGLTITHSQAADPFLQKQAQNDDSLLADLEAALGRDFLRGRLEKLETRLRPMFLSLPKGSTGLVGHPTARYALHRANSDHGWSIAGLEPTVETFNTTSLVGSGIMRGLVPPHVENILEAHISVDGFGLRDLALLAGTIEHLVYEGHRSILTKVCEILDLPTIGPMPEQDMVGIIRIYKALLLRGQTADNLTPHEARDIIHQTEQQFPGFVDAAMFLEDERNSLALVQRDRANPFEKPYGSLQLALQVVGQAADRYTHAINEPECQEIKEDLLTFERGDTGRVRLVDFYRAGLDARFFFTESKEYLQAIGALDESDTLVGPKVMVPNYVLAKSNCLAQKYIYNICCVNECEGLYGHLERGLASPDAAPEQIVSLVATLSSSTVQAPRNLSQTLRSRLDEIALGNWGRVLLHGRLFAQWMHQAFPRECPYPHLTGTTTSLAPEAWVKKTGLDYRIDTELPARAVLGGHIATLEMSLQQLSVESAADGEGADFMWTAEEEHFVAPVRPFAARLASALRGLSRFVAPAILCCAVVVALAVKAPLPDADCATKEKFFV